MSSVVQKSSTTEDTEEHREESWSAFEGPAERFKQLLIDLSQRRGEVQAALLHAVEHLEAFPPES